MRSTVWNAISLLSGAITAIAVRNLVARVWPGRHTPPLNPADRRIDWGETLAWAIASGVGAGVARVVSKRTAAAGWEWATGDSPPGIR